jgi:two-component system chemotaxis response regulator CheB
MEKLSRPRRSPTPPAKAIRVVAIGISTGGPEALLHFVPTIPLDIGVPILVVQHIQPGFLTMVVRRLDLERNRRWRADQPGVVRIAEEGERIKPGFVYFAPDHTHLTLSGKHVRLRSEPANTLHRPSVDILFTSVAHEFPGACLGVVMTGMGEDGLIGAAALSRAGGYLVAQDEATAAVYGMPKAVADAGLVNMVTPVGELVPRIVTLINASRRNAAKADD